MRIEDSKIWDAGKAISSHIPNTGHHVSNGVVRGALCAAVMVLLLCIFGSITRCSVLVSANQGQGTPSAAQTAQEGGLVQPGDDVPNGEKELSRLDRGVVLEGTVVAVVDGDTIVVADPGGNEAWIRMVGIDAPDAAHPDPSRNKPDGAAAKSYLESLLPNGTPVWLTRTYSASDHYGRMLCYVWLAEPSEDDAETTMVNALMVKSGYAKPKAMEPDTGYAELFEKLANDGETNGVESVGVDSSSSDAVENNDMA